MTFRQLSYFLAVVEEGSFTRAAQKMHVSQPSLSQQIRVLESELGGDLLERLPRAVRLTTAGRAFLPDAQAAVRAAERASQRARKALQLELGELHICTVRSIAAGLLPEIIRRWHEIYPGTVVRLHEYSHRDLSEDAVRDSVGDLGIGPPPLNWDGPTETLGWEEFKVVIARSDRFAHRAQISLSALAEHEWVAFPEDHGLNEVLLEACQRAEFSPRRAVETSQVETATRLAAAGIGPALVPENIIPSDLDAAILRVDPPLGRNLTIFAREEWGPLGRAMLDLVGEVTWQATPEDAQIVT